MKLNIFLHFNLLLGCGLFISCQNVQKKVERLDNPSGNFFEEIKYSKKLDDYLEKNRHKRHTDVNDRSFTIFKNFHSDQDLPYMNYKSSTGPNNIREMKILRKVDYYLPNKNKNENITPKTLLEPKLGGKEYKNIKGSKNFNKNSPINKIKRESPEIFGATGSSETKKRISFADKFLKLNEKERERLLEKVLKEINKKLNRPGNGYTDDESIKVKPHLLILNSTNRNKKSETEPSVWKAVENPDFSKTFTLKPSGSFNDITETVISSDLKNNSGTSSIGKQTGRNIANHEQFTNSKNFSKREDTQYQTDGIQPTTFMPEATEQKSLMGKPMEMRRVEENVSVMNNNDEITSDQSEKIVTKRNRSGQPQLYHILKNPLETREGASDSSKMGERAIKNHDEDGELMEYLKNNVKNCLQEMSKDVKEEKEKPETKEEENLRDETNSNTKEYNPTETSPELTKQLSLLDKLNNLNPNSPGFQLLWNVLHSTPSKPNILLEKNQKVHAENLGPYKSPLIAEENYLDEVSSEENENDSYDMILQTELKNLDEFAQTFTKPNMGTTRFGRFWETDLMDELLF